MKCTASGLFSAALSALILQGCTINIYKNTDYAALSNSSIGQSSESTFADLSKKASSSVKERFGTVGAAEIMAIAASPTEPLISANNPITLEVVLSVEAYVSCFYQQNDGDIIKLFPNRVIPLYRLDAGQVLRIPEANGFRVLTNKEETKESFMCLASSEDVTPNLPLVYQANTFQQVPVENFERLFHVYRKSTTNNLIARVIEAPKHQPDQLNRSLGSSLALNERY